MNNHTFNTGQQQGGALLIIMLVLVLAAIGLIFSVMDSSTVKIERDKKTVKALAEAKTALLGYAGSYKRPGSLPCPDTNNDGTSDANGNINCFSNIGRLPWKTLGLSDIRDGNGERLWFAVSANFANVPSTAIINSDDTVGLLNVCPANGCGDASPIPASPATTPLPLFSKQAAILFSSGTALVAQDRADGVDTTLDPALNIDNAKKPANYLDTIVGVNTFNNATGSANGNDFILSGQTNTYNDRLLTISTNELFLNVDKRMNTKNSLSEIATCLVEYGTHNAAVNDKRLPWPSPFSGLANYSNPLNYDDSSTRYTGRVAYHIADSTSAIPNHQWNIGAASKKQKMEYCVSQWPNWWNSWKNHVFYAVSADYAPNKPAPQSCAGNCVTVDGVGPFAAVLIFSGKKIVAQSRTNTNNAEMANPFNFLEGNNAIATFINNGKGDFTAINSATQNDVLVCIRQNLTIDSTCAAP